MVRDFLGNIKGQKGDPGEKGAKGDKGDKGDNPLEGVNANLLSLHKDDWFVGGIGSVSGEKVSYATSLTTKYFVDIEPGEVYTLTLESNHSSSTRLNWYQFTDGVYPGAEGWSGAYPQNFTFTATGNNLMVRVYFGVEVTTDDLKDIKVKLEKGSQSTAYPDVLSGIDRKIKQSENYGYVGVTAIPFDIGNTTSTSPTVIESFNVAENTEQIREDGRFILSPGYWIIDISTRPSVHDIDGGYTLGLYHKGGLVRRETKDIRSGKTLTLSTTLNIEEGDTVYVGYSLYGVSTEDFNANEFTLRNEVGNNRITMKKIGGNV